MIYKQALIESMNLLSTDLNTVFIGYNTRCGSKANGTLKNISENQLIETPVAENLMAGMAIGMALEGFKPIVYFERFDFILNAMDSIFNHLDKIKEISNTEYDPKVIFRVVIGRTKNPLYTGPTHTQNLTNCLKNISKNIKIVELSNSKEILDTYIQASKWKDSWIIIEDRDKYDEE